MHCGMELATTLDTSFETLETNLGMGLSLILVASLRGLTKAMAQWLGNLVL